MMKKIVFIHEAFPFGGAETVTSLISGYLVERGGEMSDIRMFVCRLDEEHLDERDRRNIRFVQLPVPDDVHHIKNAVFMAEYLNREKIDFFIIPVTMLQRLDYIREHTSCKIIFHNHGTPLWEAKLSMIEAQRRIETTGSWLKWLEWHILRKPKETFFGYYSRRTVMRYRKIYKHVDRFAVLCDEYKREIERVVGATAADSKVCVLTNPIGDNRRPPHLEKRHEVLYCGRMSYADKRVDRLLRIWARVEKDFPDWTLKLVGDGPERKFLEQQARDLGLQRAVFCGWCTDVEPHYDTAAILCLTSAIEGWGLVLVDAQAAGVVPIAFGCSGGVKTILGTDRRAGIVVEPGNEKAFARELAALMRDDERRRAMQPALLAKVGDYSLDRIGPMWLDMLAGLE